MKLNIAKILIIIFFLHLGFRIYSFRENFTSNFNPNYWKQRYEKSQWVTFQSKEPIGDDGLYAYAGWKYVHGENPIFISPEVPPLGKYLIGVSILIFKNQNIFALIIGLITLLVFYLYNIEIFENKLLAFIPVFFFSLEPIFYQQLRAPYLDLLQLLFLFLIFYFISKRRFIVSSIFLGCFMSTKNIYLFILVVLTVFIYLFLNKNKNFFLIYVYSLIFAFMVFLLSYIKFFLLGHTFIDFLRVQKGIITYYYLMPAKSAFGILIPMMTVGYWFTWWDGIQRINEWSISWLILFLFTVYFMMKKLQKRSMNNSFSLISVWVLVYTFFLFFIPVFPRYLLLLLPFMYNLFVWVLSKSTALKSAFF